MVLVYLFVAVSLCMCLLNSIFVYIGCDSLWLRCFGASELPCFFVHSSVYVCLFGCSVVCVCSFCPHYVFCPCAGLTARFYVPASPEFVDLCVRVCVVCCLFAGVCAWPIGFRVVCVAL